MEFLKFFNEDGGQGTGDDVIKESTDTNQEKPYKVFTSEEEYQKELKSAQSKAKNEILQKLGVKSVDEGTKSLTKAEELEKDLQTTLSRLQKIEEESVLVKSGIAEDYYQEALTLAKSKVNDNTTLEAAMKEVVTKFPNLLGKVKQDPLKVGGDKKPNKEDGETQLQDTLKNKYPWLKL